LVVHGTLVVIFENLIGLLHSLELGLRLLSELLGNLVWVVLQRKLESCCQYVCIEHRFEPTLHGETHLAVCLLDFSRRSGLLYLQQLYRFDVRIQTYKIAAKKSTEQQGWVLILP